MLLESDETLVLKWCCWRSSVLATCSHALPRVAGSDLLHPGDQGLGINQRACASATLCSIDGTPHKLLGHLKRKFAGDGHSHR